MMKILRTLKRPFIWLGRIRYRCGYGVHSPFAFELITSLVYEKTPYYAYKNLAAEEKKQARHQGKGWNSETKRVKRFLFRLVNRMQPDTIVDAGISSSASLYLQAAREGVGYTFASCLPELFLEADVPVDFLYLHKHTDPSFVEQVFTVCAGRTACSSVFVIQGIRYTKPMKKLWKQFQNDERVGITFDLYDVGILFFDKTKIKQHYKVNF